MSIPIIDCDGQVCSKSDKIVAAIESIGFVYLTNCGFDFQTVGDNHETNTVDQLMSEMGKFWALPEEEKMKFVRGKADPSDYNTGYVAPSKEILDPALRKEIREAFNVHARSDGQFKCFPDDKIPGLSTRVDNFYKECHHLTKQVLSVLSKGANPSDPEWLTRQHLHIGTKINPTNMRLLYYPPLPDKLPSDTQRCGEHSDYGTMTLLFQDLTGGLEVRARNGTFIPAMPQKNCVLVNIGDLMQRWTANKWIAVRHRVLVPKDECQLKSARQSVVFFVHPDECVVKPIDGSDEYEPINSLQYLDQRFKSTYVED